MGRSAPSCWTTPQPRPSASPFVAYSTLLGGVYGHPEHFITPNNQPEQYDGADKQARLAMLQAISVETGATPNQVVLAWLTQNTPAIVALVASRSPEHLAESLAADTLCLTPAQLDQLNRAGAGTGSHRQAGERPGSGHVCARSPSTTSLLLPIWFCLRR